ncbi:hypothetical protein F5X68DRAFT_1212 [Plectosphaerella plurivora]|uniref:Uncharacterized protein n=1 Tax=Plectosphaerella plurivora TaxID=936078 RepID=A0A9P9AG80_9PEZI|nr:hypothetical protein F5X68DRAFT_1212 [Plectosphaerella plurivora]
MARGRDVVSNDLQEGASFDDEGQQQMVPTAESIVQGQDVRGSGLVRRGLTSSGGRTASGINLLPGRQPRLATVPDFREQEGHGTVPGWHGLGVEGGGPWLACHGGFDTRSDVRPCCPTWSIGPAPFPTGHKVRGAWCVGWRGPGSCGRRGRRPGGSATRRPSYPRRVLFRVLTLALQIASPSYVKIGHWQRQEMVPGRAVARGQGDRHCSSTLSCFLRTNREG